jgi:ubiquinone/menaquinone biosynthesis C-methylase UbiE
MTTPIKIISKEEYLKNQKQPNQEQVWDNIAKPWKTYVVKKIPAVEDFLKNKKGKIIDLGCGTGRNMIPNPNIEYTGIDFSTNQLDQAKKYIKENKVNATLFKAKASNLQQIDDNTFSHGLLIATLHCIEKPEERKNALKEFYRILKPEAKGLITTWDSDDKRFSHIKNKGDTYIAWQENNIPYMRYYYLYDKQELIDLLKSVGFKIINFRKRTEDEKIRFHKKNWIIEVQKLL